MRNTYIYIYGTNSEWYQQWKFDGKRLYNVRGKVMVVEKNNDAEGTYVTTADRKESGSGNNNDEDRPGNTDSENAGQHFKIVYTEDKPGGGEGGLDDSRGVYRNRPFYIVSAMWMERVIAAQDNRNVVIQTRTGDKREQWVYDPVSKTIKNVHH